MQDLELRKLIDKLIDEKLLINDEYLRFSFYEVMVKGGVKKEQENQFLILAKTKLNNMGYKVYLKDERFFYKECNRKVELNELLIAIKMFFDTRKRTKLSWEEMYEYAKIYYEHHGYLEVPAEFKTNNGWKRDEDGKKGKKKENKKKI